MLFFPGDKTRHDGSTPLASNRDSSFYLFLRFQEDFMDSFGGKMTLLASDETPKR